MRKITSKELRKEWIKFYTDRGHVDCGAVSLVSDGSTGAMFNVAGMQPIMPYLLGKKHPLGTRLCNVQGCVRTNDIDGIGDKSHLSFFEMMGSWSLGDYFKKERCQWSYELLTEVFQFDRDHLAATVFAGDENAPRDEEGAKYRIESGFKPENVFYLPAEDNWWGLEYGPCGPDSEMFYVADVPPCGPDCKPGCHCGKYTEVGNDVFMQYEKHQDGHLTPLEKKNVDTGWGLERNLAFLNGIDDVYRTDLFAPVIASIEAASGIKYEADEKSTKSMRIIADHLRTSVMLIGDEAKLLPSNAGPGYVLRRLIRRAIRHARNLSLKTEDMLKIAGIYIDEVYNDSYPLLAENRDFILSELEKEINRFEATIENGLKEYKKIIEAKKAENAAVIDGKSAFKLYDTFGFPLELTVEMSEEEGLKVDEEAFKKCMEEAKELARENASFSQKATSVDLFEALDASVTSEFVGYDKLELEDKLVSVANNETMVSSLSQGEEGTIITEKTPFYATMGGQKGDVGSIETPTGLFVVEETVKLPGGRIGHMGHVESGTIHASDNAKLRVCAENRAKTCRNHSATHLLQAALQEILGDHVEQAGSYQDPDRTRFDFSHGQAMTKDELARVEASVNRMIAADVAVSTEVMTIEDAKKSGAMALFGEKYGETVRVVSMGDFSKELCGGTHVSHTGDIANFKILSESGVAAGTRRIEAITGANVIEYYKNVENELNAAAAMAKAQPADLSSKISSMQAEIKALRAELESMKAKAAKEAVGDVLSSVKEVAGIKLLATSVPGVDMNGLRDLADSLCDKIGGGVVVLASEADGKVNLVAKASDDAMKSGAHAGNLIKAIAGLVGGGGGGRPNMAQAGGKNPQGISDAIAEVAKVLESQIK
ncbi:MAG: alanine--tRNA ligase [Lachnospiraceae bacterium]|nr:alanine--tRNA ligase [Lachnospiraceae bacterium]